MRTMLKNAVLTLLLLAAYSMFDRGRHSSLQRQVDDFIGTMIPRDRIANWALVESQPGPAKRGETTIVITLFCA